ncbi:MAG: toll/interleukin-1 receptor domain-containing protein [Chitinophagaceae bacterium]|nr:toll/interleukin-1 receptor domain-containing protein [Chitinophagaceae bacterium]
MDKKWDAFISQASEDKDTIVRELATALGKLHLKVWYDEFSLTVGDSLSKSIDEGLLKSNFGVIIISKDFLRKKWTDYEYRSLLSKEENGKKIVLPIWHNITREEVKEFSLYLSDKVALDTSKHSVGQLSLRLLQVINPAIFDNLRRYLKFKEILKNGETVNVKRSDLKFQDKPLSKLTKQQIIRVKAIQHGIGQNFDVSLENSIYNFELDLQPDREIQTYEIMNACYLEFIHKYKVESPIVKKDIAVLLLGFSIGQLLKVKKLTEEQQLELFEFWKENYYDY